MKKAGILLLAIAMEFTLLAQAPQGFNYQAVVRDGTGQVQADKNLKIKLGLLQDSPTGTPVWEEEHASQTNGFGLVNLMVGDPGATVTGGSAATFDQIDWSAGTYYLQVQVDLMDGTGYQDLGTTQILSVPYALYSGDVSNKDDADADPTNEIQDLELTNDTLTITNNGSATPIDLSSYNDNPWTVGGDTLSHVTGSVAIGTNLPGGTKLAVQGDDTLSTKPLFEVKRKDGQTVFAVYNDSIRMYVNSNPTAKGPKGGFAIGGFGAVKGPVQEYMRITPDSVRIYIDETSAKGPRGGFAIGGFGAAKGSIVDLMRLKKDNYFIGHKSGINITSGLYNSFIGYESGNMNSTGSSNVFLGYRSGNSNTNGYSNVFIGNNSGVLNNNGNSNVYIGDSVGSSNSSGDRNVVIGSLASPYATHGDNNIIIGYKTAYASPYGSQNIFIGNYAGFNNITGQNLFIGEYSGEKTTSGTRNSFVGFFSGQNNVTGAQNAYFGQFAGMDNLMSYNTFIGYWSGGNNADGQMNTFLGYRSGQGNNGSNNVFLGYKAGEGTSGDGNVFIGINAGSYQGTRNNQLFIDNSNTSDPLIWGDFASDKLRFNGNVGAGGYSAYSSYGLVVKGGTKNSLRVYSASGQSGEALYVSGDIYCSGTITSTSDKRFKKNIHSIVDPLQKVLALQGVGFTWKSDAELSRYKSKFMDKNEKDMSFNFPDGDQVGLIAQDVEKVLPELVNTDGEGFKSVDYTKLGPVLIEAIKEQQKQIEWLKKRIEILEKQQQ